MGDQKVSAELVGLMASNGAESGAKNAARQPYAPPRLGKIGTVRDLTYGVAGTPAETSTKRN